ncbi:MAG: hypothetical protein JWN38_1135 [Candidatus Saccharibacteria bacterium]|nr:hypothetical protein [Candidatus Saccharibacteria bacterium]
MQPITKARFAEAALETFWHCYDKGQMDPSLEVLEDLGFSAVAMNFALDQDNYFVPVLEAGTYQKPKWVSPNAIPVLGLESGEGLTMPHQPALHHLQRFALERAGFEPSYIATRAAQIADLGLLDSKPQMAAISAAVMTSTVLSTDPDGRPIRFRTKPAMMLIVPEQPQPPEPPCPSVIMHELVHVIQALDRPKYNAADQLNEELEAYAVQAAYMVSGMPNSTFMERALEVDAYRRRQLGDDVYRTTPQFTRMVAEHTSLKGIML